MQRKPFLLRLPNYRTLGAILLLLLATPPLQAEPQVFALDAPAAKEVFLAGEMTDWDKGKLPLHKDADGTWRTSVDLAPGEWVYKFVVDGQWIADPATPDHDSDGSGGQHSFLFVGSGAWSEQPQLPHGHIETHAVPSKAWGKAMKVHVYLPPEFRRGANYPVLWLLHGRGMDADQWLQTGRVNRYMDNLIASGAIRSFVVVMPSSEAIPYTGKSAQFITRELTAWVRKNYGLETQRTSSGVAGMSMGGTGALRLPLRNSKLFGFGFALSGYFGDDLIEDVAKAGKLPMQLALLCGTEDELLDSNRKLVETLRAHHAEFSYREEPGAHSFNYWSNRVPEMLGAADRYFVTGQLASQAGP